jgi:hypothetical protein
MCSILFVGYTLLAEIKAGCCGIVVFDDLSVLVETLRVCWVYNPPIVVRIVVCDDVSVLVETLRV